MVNLEYKAKLDTKEFKEGLKGLNESVNGLSEKLIEIAAIYLSFDFLKDTVKDFMAAETAANDLSEAVSKRGGLAKDFDELKEQAEALSKVGIFSTKSTEGAQAMALQFGLTGEKLKEILPIVEDFAARKHIDPLTAMSEVLKSTIGKMGADLKELHIQVDKTASPGKKLTEVIGQLTTKLSGANEQIATMTSTGQLANLNNQFEELKETIGKELMEVLIRLKPYILQLFEKIKEGIKWIKENKQSIKEWGEALLITVGIFKALELAQGVKAFFTLTTAVEGATTAQKALNIATSAFPLAALAAGIALIAKGAVGLNNLQAGGADDILNAGAQKNQKEVLAFMFAKEKRLEDMGMSTKDAEEKTISDIHEWAVRGKSLLDTGDRAYKQQAAMYDWFLNKNSGFFPAGKITKTGSVSAINTADKSMEAPDKKETVRENITINITKLVETLAVHAVTLKEGTTEIQEIIANTLQQAVYGIKLNYK